MNKMHLPLNTVCVAKYVAPHHKSHTCTHVTRRQHLCDMHRLFKLWVICTIHNYVHNCMYQLPTVYLLIVSSL